MIIRPYIHTDENDVISLWTDCGLVVPWNDPARDIQRKMNEHPDLFFVGTIDDTIVGSCMAGYDGHRGWIYYLATTPALQRKGLGEKLVQHAQNALSRLGCPKINLMVRNTNAQAIQFYHKIGFNDDPVTVLSKRIEKNI